MSEREPVDPRFLTPEYWGGHSPEDNCQWLKKIGTGTPFRQQTRLRKAGKTILEDFLVSVYKEPIRTFGQGELFDGSQFPEGTVIKFEREELRLDRDFGIFDIPPYERRDCWGVISGYDTQESRALVIMWYRVSPIGSVHLGIPIEISIRVGETSHGRIKRIDYQSEWLRRVNKIELYKIGQGVREETRQRRRTPLIGRIFGSPEPETA